MFYLYERPILLIDEIDKADIEFPNDLLLEPDRMESQYALRDAAGHLRAGAAPDRDDHLEQREGTAGRLPAREASSTTSASLIAYTTHLSSTSTSRPAAATCCARR